MQVAMLQTIVLQLCRQQKNYGVSPVEPGLEADGRSIAKPTKVWDIAEDGTYNFGGDATRSTLYTNYKFKGKTSYTININNNHSSKTLTVKCIGVTVTKKVKAGESGTITVSSVKADQTFYISFSAPSDFDGTVE